MDWTVLPAEGRTGSTPGWPLIEPSDRELAIWTEEWRRPQAILWEHNAQEIEVAMYVRSLVDAENPGAGASLRNLVRGQQEALGLTLPGMTRYRWRIAAADQPPPAPTRKGARDRAKEGPLQP